MDESCGFLTDPDKVETLIEAIKLYRNDVELMREHGQIGRKRVMEKFSTQKMLKDYLELYS